MDIILIAAMAPNRVIGKDNSIPWRIPEELRFFKTTTMGSPIIMGRKTFESLPKALPGRRNIVISRNTQYDPTGAEAVPSLEKALELCAHEDKVFVIGGAQIFELALAHATTLLISLLDQPVEGDTYFPEISPDIFVESKRQRLEPQLPFTVVTYHRKG